MNEEAIERITKCRDECEKLERTLSKEVLDFHKKHFVFDVIYNSARQMYCLGEIDAYSESLAIISSIEETYQEIRLHKIIKEKLPNFSLVARTQSVDSYNDYVCRAGAVTSSKPLDSEEYDLLKEALK